MAFVHSQTVARDLDLLFVLLPDLGRWFKSLYQISDEKRKDLPYDSIVAPRIGVSPNYCD